jgi:hypothetical protein
MHSVSRVLRMGESRSQMRGFMWIKNARPTIRHLRWVVVRIGGQVDSIR